MSEVFDSIMKGLNEALDDAKGKKRLTRRIDEKISVRES